MEVMPLLCSFEERVGRNGDDDSNNQSFKVAHAGVLIVNNIDDV